MKKIGLLMMILGPVSAFYGYAQLQAGAISHFFPGPGVSHQDVLDRLDFGNQLLSGGIGSFFIGIFIIVLSIATQNKKDE